MSNKNSYSKYELQYMTRPEAKKAINKYKKAILPFGATEQHASHLPLGTDTFLAHAMSIELAKHIKAIVLPAIPVGYSWGWRRIQGTLNISVDHVKGIVKDISTSLACNGLEELIIMNGHGGNDSALKYAVRELSDELALQIYYFTYPGLEEISEYLESPIWHGMGHACEWETSLMLAVRPDLCDMKKAVREYPEEDLAYEYYYSSFPMGNLSKSGSFGDATLATKEKGEVILNKIIDYVKNVLEIGEKKNNK